jgi:hypothetical protein
LQMEADVQGGIIVDTWSDERGIDRKLTDVRSYPFSFLVQSFLPQPPRGGTPRVNSPAIGAGSNPRESEDVGVNMREVDGLLSEIAVMLGRWSLYTRFLAGKCKVWPTIRTPELCLYLHISRTLIHQTKLLSSYQMYWSSLICTAKCPRNSPLLTMS